MELSVCRTCLGTNSLNPIFNASVDPTRYSTAIFISTGIKVKQNDGMPQQMCSHCVNNINNFLKFRKLCRDSEVKLLQLRKKNSHEDVKCIPNKADQELCPNKADHQNHQELCDEKFEIDLNSQNYEENREIVKLENDSDLENDTPLSCLTENKKKDDWSDKSKKTEEITKEEKKIVQRVSCPICHVSLSPRSLRVHISSRHGDGNKCGFCEVDFGSMEALIAHAPKCGFKKMRGGSRSGKESVSCDICQKVMQRASLRAHVAVKHKGLGPVCEHCGRRFGNKLRLSEHLRAKHGYEKLQCARCEFRTASNAALQNHERRHRGEKPFVCEECGAKFHAAYLLAQHRQSHRTDRRVKCTLCGATFKTTNSLHAHRLARHGARAHRCPLCARTYSCRHYAVKHLRTVHGFKGAVPPLQVDPVPAT